MAGASVPPGTKLKETASQVKFTDTINGVPVTVDCGGQAAPGFTDTAVVDAGDDRSLPVGDPRITGCFDTLGGHDVITSSGKWKLLVNGTGRKLAFVIPKRGLTLTTSVQATCKVVAAPSAPVTLSGTYSSSSGTDTVMNGSVAVKGSGCTAESPMRVTLTATLSPNPGQIPPFASTSTGASISPPQYPER